MDALQLLHYARHPLVGAFIGYVTTDVAIRLLFRPLKPWRILGVRIPLTPGVLPRKRHDFAEKVGNMVGSHLLTSADVKSALVKQEFRRELQGAVNEKVDALLDRKFGAFATLFPPDFHGWLHDAVDRTRGIAMQELFAYLESPAFAVEVQQFLKQKGDELLSRNLQSLLPEEQFRSLRVRLKKGVRDFLRSEEVGKNVASFVERKVDGFVASDLAFRDLIPAGLVELVARSLEKETAALLDKVMEDEAFRTQLKDNLQEAFVSALGSLNGITGFFAKLIDPARLLSLFPDLLERLERELSRWFSDNKTRQQIMVALRQGLQHFLDRKVSEVTEGVPYRKVAAVRRLARKKAVKVLRSPQTTRILSTTLAAGLEKLAGRPLVAVLTEGLSEQELARLQGVAAEEVLAALRSREARQVLERLAKEKSEEWLFQRPVGQLSDLIPASGREELAETLYRQLAELLVNELPPLVEAINIQRIVQDKINSLDILQVEGLLLDIMRESFMFLNLFGAFLGFLIGVLNLLIPGFG